MKTASQDRLMWELVKKLAKPLPAVYQQSWLTREDPAAWKYNAYLEEGSEG